MELFKTNSKIDFMGISKLTTGASFLLIACSLICIITYGLNFGLEFTGGTQIELLFAKPIETGVVELLLEESTIEGARVQHYGSAQDIMIRLNYTQTSNDELKILMQEIFTGYDFEIRQIDFVGSEVGQQLAEKGTIAVIVAIITVMLYIALRFEYRLAASSSLALVHDAICVLGVFAFFQIEFDLAALAAILAVIGYSLNDTIVVFDRVRENFRYMRKACATEVMNLSINQTLSRTIMTSFLTLLVTLALLIFGGETLFGFSLALSIGILVGTYSSIYVAGSMAIMLGLSREDLLSKPKALDTTP